MDVKICLGIEVLDLVDPWLEFSVFKDEGRVVGRGQGHGWQIERDDVGSTSK